MSWQAVDAVLDAWFPDMPPGPRRRYGVGSDKLKLVALAVADQVQHDGPAAHPGLRRLADRSSSTTDTVRCALDALVELAVLVLADPSNGRSADRYRVDLAVLAGMTKQARSARVHPRADRDVHPRASARARPAHPARARPAQDVPYVQHSANDAPPLRLAAVTPPDRALQRVAALLAEAAELSGNPAMFGTRYRDHLVDVDERVGELLDETAER